MANQDPSDPIESGQEAHAQPPPRRTHTFVLRLVVDAHGRVHGLVSEPGAHDEWRPGFGSLEQLTAILNRRLDVGQAGTGE